MRIRNFIIFGFLLVFTTSCSDLLDSLKAAEEEPVVVVKEKVCALGGAAVKGVIDAATVTVYSVTPTGGDGELLATSKTDATGSWSATPPTCSPDGVYRVKVDEGTYTSEATQDLVTNTVQYTAIVDLNSANISASAESLSITPIATFIDAQASASLAASNKANNGTGDRFAASTALSTAIYNANQKVKAQFGLTTNPLLIKVNLDNPDETESNREGTKLGLILGALTQQADDLGLTDPGNLIVALAADIADGTFDGLDAANQVVQIVEGTEATTLDINAGTTGLATAIDTYIVNPDSTFVDTGFVPDDVVTIVEEIDVCVVDPTSCIVEEIVVESACGFNIATITETTTNSDGTDFTSYYDSFVYDTNGFVVSAVSWGDYDGDGVKENKSSEIVTTDDRGRVTSVIDDGTLQEYRNMTFTYNDDNRMLSMEENEYWDAEKTILQRHGISTYTYDGNGDMTSSSGSYDEYDVAGTTKTQHSTDSTHTLVSGQRTGSTTSYTGWYIDSSEYTGTYTVTYDYDSSGNLIKEAETGEGGYVDTIEYVYNSDGLVASSTKKSFYPDYDTQEIDYAAPENIEKSTFTYNEDGSAIKQVSTYDWSADGVIDETTTTNFTYADTPLSLCNPDYKGGGNFFFNYAGIVGFHEMYYFTGNFNKPAQQSKPSAKPYAGMGSTATGL